MIDCGEGTQVQLRKKKIGFLKISHIFISHLHGDHYYGLIGLISSMQLLGRTSDLHIYAPKGLKEIPDSVIQHVLKKFWNESRIQTFYKLDEQHNFTDDNEKEKEWVATLIEQITQFGYIMDSQKTRPSNGLNWNPTNDLYFFITVPSDTNDI